MPNHFHIYLSSPRAGLGEDLVINNNITKYISKICTSYSMYFNKKYNRTGSLFEGRFKAVHVKEDIQAKYLFSYIHLNPVKLIEPEWKEKGIEDKDGALKFLNEYKWSSYLDYKEIKRKESKILNRKNFINYLPNVLSFNKEIFEWINIK
jgi:putative transposase